MESARRGIGGWLSLIGAVFIVIIGLILAVGGGRLAMLGGSLYYLLAGVGLVASGVLLAMRRPLGGLIFTGVLVATVAWGLWESGPAFWPLLPRLFSPAVVGLIVLLVLAGLPAVRGRTVALVSTALGVVLAMGVLGVTLNDTFTAGQATAPAPAPLQTATASGGDWRFYGRDAGGTRFAPYAQVNKDNVARLKVAWTLRTGDVAKGGSEDQNTPIQVGDTVYACTPTNIVIAVDADTGAERWRHNPKIRPSFWNRCRGVGYWETPAIRANAALVAGPPPPSPALCDRRIISSTIDARLIALDAATGQPCPGFGQGGAISLREGMGEVKPGFYFPTSTPTVAGDRIIIGGWVMDNRELGEPSGVVRAFSAETGELIWAWDLGNPTIAKLPPQGQTYTRGTPNVWSTPAFDEALGLVFLPTGNATPDYWGSHRSDASEQYSSSVVALEIATGRERWRFQTVHHDLWDYDVPSQPMVADFPNGQGGTTPAIIQLTKRGQIFVLDRATGRPLTKVEERPVPGGPAKGEWVSPTQPYSTGMPAIGAERLTEAKMWGATPLDQLACRIAYRSHRYEGDFTPPSTVPTLQYPSNGGGQNWGGGTLDATHRYLIVPDLRMAMTVSLGPAKRPGLSLDLVPNRSARGAAAVAYQSQNDWMMGPLSIPCLQPPNGTITAIDLTTRKIAWQVPMGSAEGSGPFGLASGLPIPLGNIGLGGPISTAGGLTFHASTQDPYLRAYDSGTGKVLWKGRLPVGVGGTPMSYVSPKTGRQYVVVSAGGARMMPQRGDYVVAYALPK